MAESLARVAVDVDVFNEDDAQKDNFLTFHLGDEDYGIEIRQVTEIIGIQKITEVPDMPESIRSVINLRGRVIPVMDVRYRFKLEQRDYDERTCIVVVEIDETSVGLIVDQVKEVVEIPVDQIEPPPCRSFNSAGSYINGMGKIEDEVKILLNVQQSCPCHAHTKLLQKGGRPYTDYQS